LIRIDFSFTEIGDYGLKALAVALAKNLTLKEVDLISNQISAEGVEAMVNALVKNKTVLFHSHQKIRPVENDLDTALEYIQCSPCDYCKICDSSIVTQAIDSLESEGTK